MADTDTTADRTSLRSAADSLTKAKAEVSNIAFEQHSDVRDRIVALLNIVGERLGEMGDRISQAEDRKDGSDADESGKVPVEDSSSRESANDPRKNRR